MALSRAEKNKELYEQLLADPESEIQTNDLEKIANRLNKIDADNFSEMNTVKASSLFQHTSNSTKPSFFEEKEIEETPVLTKNTANLPKFNNDYLDDFLNEVKQYNISKGTRTQEDTQTALFNKILSESRNDQNLQKEQVIKQEPIVSAEFEEKVTDTNIEEKKGLFADKLNLRNEIKELLKDTKQEAKEIEEQDKQKALEITQELLEKTASIKAQMDNYDSKLVDVDDKMDKVNKTLNIVLVTLFLALIALLVVIIIYVIKQKVI